MSWSTLWAMILDRADSFLLLIDLQERLVPAVREPRRLVGNCLRLMHAAEMLEVPLFLTEHCADKIGPVVEEIRTRVEETQVLQKRSFSTLREPRCRERLEGLGRLSPVIAGTEAHVCVLQTALDLKTAGYAPRYVVDAVSTRKESDLTAAVARVEANGIEIMTVEMVLFEWLGRGDDPKFGSVLELIKTEP